MDDGMKKYEERKKRERKKERLKEMAGVKKQGMEGGR